MIHKTEKRPDGTGNIITEQKYNHLAPAEMMKEENYNQIDGVITATTPSFAERMKAAKDKAKEHNNRKSERHKEKRHSRKSDRHKQQRHNSNNQR